MAHNCIIGGGKVQGLRFGIGFIKCWHSMYKRNAVALLQIASLMAHQGIGIEVNGSGSPANHEED